MLVLPLLSTEILETVHLIPTHTVLCSTWKYNGELKGAVRSIVNCPNIDRIT
jgi:hypothetical protein